MSWCLGIQARTRPSLTKEQEAASHAGEREGTGAPPLVLLLRRDELAVGLGALGRASLGSRVHTLQRLGSQVRNASRSTGSHRYEGISFEVAAA